MWNSGPEWVPQQRKKVAANTRNCGEVNTTLRLGRPPARAMPAAAAAAGARRIRKLAGSSSAQTAMPMTSCEKRQSVRETSSAAMGATVIGATPMPAETSDTARLRLRSNQAATVAISGAKMAPPPTPTRTPNRS